MMRTPDHTVDVKPGAFVEYSPGEMHECENVDLAREWIGAELNTTDLSTKFVKIVVTDDRGETPSA